MLTHFTSSPLLFRHPPFLNLKCGLRLNMMLTGEIDKIYFQVEIQKLTQRVGNDRQFNTIAVVSG